jgi:rubredoxin
MSMEGKDLDPVPPRTAGAGRHDFRCSICGRFLHPESSFARYDFTPDTNFTYERVEFYHTYCDAKTGPRSTFRMDFAP